MKIAVVGCGAISSSFHGPSLSRMKNDGVTAVFIDPDVKRAQSLAHEMGFEEAAASVESIIDSVDAAIIASPAHTHVSIAKQFVERGIPVLSEKPLGTTVAEVTELELLAKEKNTVVAVNQTRRFIPACAELERKIRLKEYGDVKAIHFHEGDVFDWPAATPSMFGERSGGRGVLLDIGVHVIDLLAWWLQAPIDVKTFRDDSFGGSEAHVFAQLKSGTTDIEVRLSWLAKQKNMCTIVFDKATVYWSIYDLDRFKVKTISGSTSTVVVPTSTNEFAGLADSVIGNFIAAVRGRHTPAVSPSDALTSMKIIEQCYSQRETFDMPWHRFAVESGNE